MTCLLDLSHELLQGILGEVDGHDLAALSATCRALKSFVQGNRMLCKTVYLRTWASSDKTIENQSSTNPRQDHPREAEPCWETSIRNLVALKKLLESDKIETKREDFAWAAPLIAPLLAVNKSPANARFLADLFKSQKNIDVFLASSSLFEHAGNLTQQPAATEELRQLSAKLQVALYTTTPPALTLCLAIAYTGSPSIAPFLPC